MQQRRRKQHQQVVNLLTLPVWSSVTHVPWCAGNRSPQNFSLAKISSQDRLRELCCGFHPCVVTFAQRAWAVCHTSVSIFDLSCSGIGALSHRTQFCFHSRFCRTRSRRFPDVITQGYFFPGAQTGARWDLYLPSQIQTTDVRYRRHAGDPVHRLGTGRIRGSLLWFFFWTRVL